MGRLQRIVGVCLLIAAVGGHWFVLQSAAWVSMLVKYSENAPFREAVLKTFDGQHPCKMCKAVAEGKKSESNKTLVKLEIKLDFTLQASAQLLFPPQFDAHCTAPDFLSPRLRASPPLPPPRMA